MAENPGIGHSWLKLSKVDMEICPTDTHPMDTDEDLMILWNGFRNFPQSDFLIVDENSSLHESFKAISERSRSDPLALLELLLVPHFRGYKGSCFHYLIDVLFFFGCVDLPLWT